MKYFAISFLILLACGLPESQSSRGLRDKEKLIQLAKKYPNRTLWKIQMRDFPGDDPFNYSGFILEVVAPTKQKAFDYIHSKKFRLEYPQYASNLIDCKDTSWVGTGRTYDEVAYVLEFQKKYSHYYDWYFRSLVVPNNSR